MKTIILNGSPRKNWNTAQALQSVQKGAESVGAETEYIDLYDLTYTGCRKMREKQFPLDLEKAFQMGTRLGRA